MNNVATSFPTNVIKSMPRFRILLSEREMTILDLISREYSDKEIGKKLFLSHHTIHTHRKNLMIKLDVRKSTGLVRRGFELGLLNVS